jgi:aspartate kinase
MIDSGRTGDSSHARPVLKRTAYPETVVISDEATSRLRPRGKQTLAPFEKQRGVTDVTAAGTYTYLTVALEDAGRAARELEVYRTLSGRRISINLVKLQEHGLCFVVDEVEAQPAVAALSELGLRAECKPSVTMVRVYAPGMRAMSGLMGRIAGALLRARVSIVQTGDDPDTVFCLVESHLAKTAVEALCAEFQIPPAPKPILVQKFGGKSMGTAEARGLAAERVREAFAAGYHPVVVVSAIGRMGEPYATDTLLSHLHSVAPETEPSARERDMLMACGEIISTVIMAQTLKSLGLRSIALTGAQAGILTDYNYGDAQILDIKPDYIFRMFDEDRADVVVVAGFQGATQYGAITTLGRGGSDTTAAALAVAVGAEKVEIYTHVDGVMTADPEIVPEARTLPVVTYEEVCSMAHQGAKVLHPRAAEIAMLHQIPLWVKSSFVRSPGTQVAALGEIQPAVRGGVTGIAQISKLVYFTLTSLEPGSRAEAEYSVYRAIGEAGINFYLNSLGPETSSFIVEQGQARQTELILGELGLRYRLVEDCEMVSIVALNMWEEPGFLCRIAHALFEQEISVLQMADSEGSVSCLVGRKDAPRAVKALHDCFELSK